MNLYRLIRPLAFAMDAETAHRMTIRALKFLPSNRAARLPRSLEVRFAGLHLPSPVGLAAGFDKDAEVPEAMLQLGFGFVEVGTVTPRPQSGNPRPRLFRLTEDQAVINRMGFNNGGQRAAFSRLQQCRHLGVIGVNVGANKDSEDRVADYVSGVRSMAPVADYLTINISSPNTPGLRGLQDQGALDELLGAVQQARMAVGPPVFLKVAPDLADDDPERIVRSAIDHGIDAVIVANTTVSRPALKSKLAQESGGLSGAPLRGMALEALKRFRAVSGGEMPLIAAGGIANGDDAWDRICAGASLVQVYSAMVYDGPGIARRIALGLAAHLKRAGMSNISEAVGSAAA
ncbi:MAG: quinone-dependent dihydroorotate dehydrogenase [Sphingomicrobium sp.]